MSGDQKGVPCEPDRPHDPNDVYGGRWSPSEVPPDRSGRGSAPRPPGAPPPRKAGEPPSFQPRPDQGPGIAADDTETNARSKARRRNHDRPPKRDE